NRLGIADREALQFIGGNRQTQDVARHLRPGNTVSAKSSEGGELLALYVEL
ncbi:MAG TPA: peptidase M23, partial [Candidatus Accumulibacter sp.]|nr:peptidase M23 [Accumulibacter sp.]